MIRIGSLFLAVSIVLLSYSVRGEEIQLGSAPMNPAKAGFTMFVLTERLGNEGFQPITLRFRAIGKSFHRERRLRILFRPRTQYATELDYQFGCSVTVPQGVKSYEVPILVPHFYRWESCSVQIIEDGRRWGKASSKLGIPTSVKDWGQTMSIGVIVPSDAATSGEPWATFPDVRSMVTVLGRGPINEKVSVTRFDDKQARDYIENLVTGWARFRVIDEDVLQTSWLGYSQLDLILAPYPVLERIEKTQPAKSNVLRHWVSAGGQLWAYAWAGKSAPKESWLAGKRTDKKNEIRYSPDPSKSLMLGRTNDVSPIQYEPWNYGSYSSTNYSSQAGEKSRQSVYGDLDSAEHPMVQTLQRAPFYAQFEVMRYGMGRVVLIHAEDPFPGSFQLWKSLEMDRQTWSERNGVDYGTGNDSYWAWLMATVGQPPVTMFVILNALFVLVMGPVLYFGLRRRSRLYLLYFLAPSLAFITTMGLFLYAFISDGFDNRGRIRQLTWIDGRHPVGKTSVDQESFYPIVNQSRETYYTVMDNQQGLRFDADSFVLPVHHAELMNNFNYRMADDTRSGEYSIDQVGQERIYSGDFLPTRTQVHYLTTRPSVESCPIKFAFGSSEVTLTNQLSTPLSIVGVRDENGKYWTGSDVPPNATVKMKAAESNSLRGIALAIVDPDTSNLPVSYRSPVSNNDRTGMEAAVLKFSRKPPRRSFLAVTEVEPSQFALRECLQEDCVRLIGGLLP
jgi:hypothetical protein